jgi:hypothetical protein
MSRADRFAPFAGNRRPFAESVRRLRRASLTLNPSRELLGEGAMSGRDVAWTTAAATGLGCAVTAAAAVWLLLTDPMAVTMALGAHDLGALLHTAFAALHDVALGLVQ